MAANSTVWRDRRVLVAGCTGFLGTAISRELLAQGAIVVGMARDRSGFATFEKTIAAGRFHVMTGRIEDAVRLQTTLAIHEVSAIFQMTGMPYALDSVLQAVSHSHAIIPVVTARPDSELRTSICEARSVIPIGVAHFGEVFGPGDRRPNRIASHPGRTRMGARSMPSSFESIRDFVHIDDAARACLAVAADVGASRQSCHFTFRSGWEFSDSSWAGALEDYSSERQLLIANDTPANPLGWQPTIPLARAIQETVDWQRLHPAAELDERHVRKAA